jgi:hypothetical protein
MGGSGRCLVRRGRRSSRCSGFRRLGVLWRCCRGGAAVVVMVVVVVVSARVGFGVWGWVRAVDGQPWWWIMVVEVGAGFVQLLRRCWWAVPGAGRSPGLEPRGPAAAPRLGKNYTVRKQVCVCRAALPSLHGAAAGLISPSSASALQRCFCPHAFPAAAACNAGPALARRPGRLRPPLRAMEGARRLLLPEPFRRPACGSLCQAAAAAVLGQVLCRACAGALHGKPAMSAPLHRVPIHGAPCNAGSAGAGVPGWPGRSPQPAPPPGARLG